MNLKNLLTKLGFLFVLLFFVGTSAFAQVYVSATNGDDTFGTGSQATPYRTIQKAIDVAPTGSTIFVEAGIYNSTVLPSEGNPISITTNRNFTFVGTAVGVNTTVELTAGFTLNNASAVATFGSSGTAKFNFGTGNALVLTAGAMNITPANVVLGNNATVVIGNGTLNAVPTTGANLNVTFNGTNAISSTSAFLPNSLGAGTLTLAKASGALTIDNSSLTVGLVNRTGIANVNINGNMVVGSATAGAAQDVINAATGTFTIGSSSANTLTLYSTIDAGTVGTDANVGEIKSTAGGTLIVNSAVNFNVKNTGTATDAGDPNGRTITLALVNATAGNINLNSDVNFVNTNVKGTTGTSNQNSHVVTLSNSGAGTVAFGGSILTPNSTQAFTNPANAAIWVKLSNTGGGTFTTRAAALRGVAGTEGISNKTAAGTMTLGQAGDSFSADWDIVNDIAASTLTINAAGTFGGALTNNNATSVVVFGANSSFAGLVTNAGNIKVNGNTITFSRTGAAALNNTGDIYSTTSAATGNGVLRFTGAAPTMTGTGNIPNVEIASATSFSTAGNIVYGNFTTTGAGAVTIGGASDIKGTLNVNGTGTITIDGATTVRGDVNMTSGNITMGTAGLTVEGTFTMPQGTFSFGSRTLTLKGNFNRTGGTIDAAAAGTGTLNFAGARSQTFTPGTQMNVYDVTVNNTGNYLVNVVEDDKVTVTASLIVRHNFAIGTGHLALGTSNIRMQQAGGVSARFTNGGRGYSSSGIGGIIFEGSGANTNDPAGVAGLVGDGAVITGTQPYSNIYVRLTTPANNVFVLGAVKISGTVTLDAGGIVWNAAPDEGTDGVGVLVDNFTASTLTLDDVLTTPTVVINTENTHGSPFLVDGADGGAVALGITSSYNLSYTGQTNRTMAATDFVSGSVKNLSIIAGTAGKTITFLAANGSITGNLNVAAGDVLELTNGAARTLTLSSNTGAHVVNGTVQNGTISVTGTGATLTGGQGTTNASSVAILSLAPASAGTFTSTGMKVIGALVVNQANLTTNITMNATTATVNSFTNTAGTTNLNMNSAAVTAAANYVVTAGAVTLTMNGAAAGTRTIGGTLDVNGGTLTLGSHVNVTGAFGMAGTGSLVLGDFNLTLANNFTHAGTGTITAGTGALVANAAATRTWTFTSVVDIPNFTLNAATGIQLATNGMTVTNTFVHTTGDLDLNSLPLTISGNTYTYTAGTYTNTGAAATGKVALTGSALTVTAAANPVYAYLQINSDGTVTFATSDNATPTPRTFTVAGVFTHTKGNLALGINDLELTFIGGDDADYITAATAGTVTGSTGSNLGEVVFNGNNDNAVMTLADNYSIQNISIQEATAKTDSKVLTIGNNVTLGDNFTVTASARLVLGNGATITRSAGVFDVIPTFGTTVNVAYNPPGALATDKEIPAAAGVLNNLSITSAAGVTTLSANTTVNGTLFLTNGQISTGTKTLTIAAGGTINRSAGSFAAGATNVPTVTTYNLVYSGSTAIGGIGAEFVSDANAVTSLTVSMTGNGVLIDANRTVGSFTMSPTGAGAANVYVNIGSDNATRTLTVKGATVINNGIVSTRDAAGSNTNASSIVHQGALTVNGGSYGLLGTDSGTNDADGGLNVTFNAAAAQNVTLSGNVSIPNVTLNSTATTAAGSVVNVTGGNLTITNLLTFQNGILNMGTNTLILPRPTGAQNSGLAFDRSGVTVGKFGHVVGKISRAALTGDGLNAGTNGRFEFPTGTITGSYRPAVINFTPDYPVATPVSIVAEMKNTPPTGTNGLPLAAGTGVSVGSYSNYYWSINTTPSNLPPTQRFDIELRADSLSYPYSLHENLRIIKREGTSSSTPWVLQGTVANYANYLDPIGTDTSVIVRTTSSIGGLVAQGSSFAIGIPGAIGVTVSGQVTYFNSVSTPMNNVTVTLKQGATTVATTTTDASGNFTFTGVAAGSYTIDGTTTKAWGGVTANDALDVLKYVAGGFGVTFAPIQVSAANVNNDASVTANDALDILKRVSNWNGTNSFAKGNWVIDSRSVTVAAANVTGQNLSALAVGDVNRSYVPTAEKRGSSVSFANEGTIQVNPKSEMIELPIRVSASANVAAMNLAFTYPTDMFEFVGVSSAAKNVYTSNVNGRISVAWASVNALNLKADEAIVTLRFKPTAEFKVGKSVNVEVDNSVSEVADINGQVLNVALKGAAVEASIPKEFALAQNYPNPFNPSTTISYELPVAGTVNLTVFNSLGEVVTTLVNSVQEAGSYKLTFNASNLASGIYLYRIDVKGEKSFSKVNKMILMK